VSVFPESGLELGIPCQRIKVAILRKPNGDSEIIHGYGPAAISTAQGANVDRNAGDVKESRLNEAIGVNAIGCKRVS
jgi:hypothetical protein